VNLKPIKLKLLSRMLKVCLRTSRLDPGQPAAAGVHARASTVGRATEGRTELVPPVPRELPVRVDDGAGTAAGGGRRRRRAEGAESVEERLVFEFSHLLEGHRRLPAVYADAGVLLPVCRGGE
jgi:hypothetical protein